VGGTAVTYYICLKCDMPNTRPVGTGCTNNACGFATSRWQEVADDDPRVVSYYAAERKRTAMFADLSKRLLADRAKEAQERHVVDAVQAKTLGAQLRIAIVAAVVVGVVCLVAPLPATVAGYGLAAAVVVGVGCAVAYFANKG
jgi:hypothetical protein